jgi:hydroxyethylthiazole kinase
MGVIEKMNNYIEPLQWVRQNAPLIQCITNFVTVNDCANMILASGGSPSMSQDIQEVEESICSADALVCNMGAIDFTDSMILAGKKANFLGKPVVLDPVAAGGTKLRRNLSRKLLDEVHFTVIRGNASEIRFLAGEQAVGSGVDVSITDAITEGRLSEAIELSSSLARQVDSVIAISGALDIVSDGLQTVVLRNGCATMARITGSGCMLTSLIGAFCGASPQIPFSATVCAMATMGVAGEIAEAKRLKNKTGNASFRTDLIDAVFNMTAGQLQEAIHYEVYKK